ncbi:aldo-keto reductase [Tanacetum coccineum]
MRKVFFKSTEAGGLAGDRLELFLPQLFHSVYNKSGKLLGRIKTLTCHSQEYQSSSPHLVKPGQYASSDIQSSRKVRSKRKMYKPEDFEISKFYDAVGIDKSGVHLPSFSHRTVKPKVSGPSGQMTWIRGCPTSLDNWNIHIDNRTDAVCYEHRLIILIFINCTGLDPARQYSYISFDEQLATLGKAVDAGKIRLIGVSNETPYKVMKFLQAAEKNPASVLLEAMEYIHFIHDQVKVCHFP